MGGILNVIGSILGIGGGGNPGGGGATPPFFPPGGGAPTGTGLPNNNTFQNILQAVGIGSGVLGSILNRPKGLSKEQQRAYDMLLAQLSSVASSPAQVNPAQRQQLMTQIASSLRGAQNRIGGDFASRGLSRSGLRAAEEGRASRTAEGAQIAGEVDLLNSAKTEQNQKIAQLQSLLMGSPSMQGASAAGVGLSSLSNSLGYLLTLNQLGRSRTPSTQGGSGGSLQQLLNLISIGGGAGI